ncbi:uncharacterized protein LOC116254108 isoform X2 [Nymphaea colorata]|nr:uncharacterized protein LOC116254108 isoform X2 [Nymphaea colorata]
MDFVGDPGELLKMMESCKIGTKRALFYQAYALYYEKRKRYVEAEKIYQLGVEILAVPTEELQKSYQQFLNRIHAHKRRKSKMRVFNASTVTMEQREGLTVDGHGEPTDKVGSITTDKVQLSKEALDLVSADGAKLPAIVCRKENLVTNVDIPLQSNNKVGRRMILSAESCPPSTVPIEPLSENAGDAKFSKESLYSVNGLHYSSAPTSSALKGDVDLDLTRSANIELRNDGNGSGIITSLCASKETEQITDNGLELQNGGDVEAYQFSSFCGDDTIVVSKFVGCAIVGKSEAEDACHHGLVDPTINTKEVMDDINSMFKKPLDIQVKNRLKPQKFQVEKVGKQEKIEIFVDECLGETGISSHDTENDGLSLGPVTHGDETIMICRFTEAALVDESDSPEGAYHHGLVEPTLFTKEAMKDINSMFGKPIEFEKPSVRQKRTGHNTNMHLTGGALEILVDDADSGSANSCFGNEKACILSQSQLRCDSKFEKYDALKKQETKNGDDPCRGVLTILADDDDDEDGYCDDKYKHFDWENRLQCGSHTESCSTMRKGDDRSACRFIETTDIGETESDACCHGLVDPMINLEQAKSDTNSIKRPPDFGETNGTEPKESDFRGKQQSTAGFTVLVDENLVGSTSHLPKRSVQEFDLFEHTITTKEAIADINNMFGRPLDY